MLESHFGPVQIVKREPVRAAHYCAVSATPEDDGSEFLTDWFTRHGLTRLRRFGADCEVSEAAQKAGHRGYEFWWTAAEEITPAEGVDVVELPGGLYAKMQLSDPFSSPFEVIPGGWQHLMEWLKQHPIYQMGSHQWLEEVVETPDATYLDLYLAIAPAIPKPEPWIEQKDAFLVAGTAYEGKNAEGEIPRMWDEQFIPRIGELAGIQSGGFYGVARASQGGEPGVFAYLAGVEVRSLDALPPGMVGWQVPAQRYAVMPAYGVQDLGPAIHAYYHNWLPQSKEWQAADGPMLEDYPESFPLDDIILLYFPVRRIGRD